MAKIALIVFVLAIAVCVLADTLHEGDGNQRCKRVGRRCTEDAQCCKKLHCSKRLHRCLPHRPNKPYGIEDFDEVEEVEEEEEEEVDMPVLPEEEGEEGEEGDEVDDVFRFRREKCQKKHTRCNAHRHCCRPYTCHSEYHKCL